MVTLKENIQYEVRIFEPKSLEKSFSLERKIESKIMATIRDVAYIYREGNVTTPNLT